MQAGQPPGVRRPLPHGPERTGPLRRTGNDLPAVRDHVGFAALHVHPFVVAALLPGATVLWAGVWYASGLAGTVAVVCVPLHLAGPSPGPS